MTIKKLNSLRQRIAALQEEREALRRRPRTREEALAAVEDWIETNTDHYTVESPLRYAEPTLHFQLGDDTERTDLHRLLATLFPDRVRQYAAAQIDLALAEAEPISQEAADRRREEIDAEVLALERQEEALIEQLEDGGEPVARRAEADPRAVLGLDEPPARPAPLAREHKNVVEIKQPRSAVVGGGVPEFVSGKTRR